MALRSFCRTVCVVLAWCPSVFHGRMMIGAGLAHLKEEKKKKYRRPELIGPLRQCPCNAFQIDYFGDHLQTSQAKSAATQVHDWVVRRLGGILSSVGHRVKIHGWPYLQDTISCSFTFTLTHRCVLCDLLPFKRFYGPSY